jgi:hypothetical protein
MLPLNAHCSRNSARGRLEQEYLSILRCCMQIDGKTASAIKSKALCHSLLEVYLGSNPVSPDAKQTIGSGLASMLAHE